MSEAPIYLLIDNQQSGPHILQQVREMWKTRAVSEGTLFWKEGQAGWEPLGKIASLLDTPPPAEPQPAPKKPAPAEPAPKSISEPVKAAKAQEGPDVSGLAIASMVLGILGLFIGIPAIPAIICGHYSLTAIKRSAGDLSGRGMAVAGLVMGYITLLMIVIIGGLAAVALPVYWRSVEKGCAAQDLSHAKQIALAIKLYAIDNHDRTPPDLNASGSRSILPIAAFSKSPLATDSKTPAWIRAFAAQCGQQQNRPRRAAVAGALYNKGRSQKLR